MLMNYFSLKKYHFTIYDIKLVQFKGFFFSLKFLNINQLIFFCRKYFLTFRLANWNSINTYLRLKILVVYLWREFLTSNAYELNSSYQIWVSFIFANQKSFKQTLRQKTLLNKKLVSNARIKAVWYINFHIFFFFSLALFYF